MSIEKGVENEAMVELEREESVTMPRFSPALEKLTEALSAEQFKALGLLSEGESIMGAAQKVGVCRGTLYRWIRIDPQFRAAYNAWQLEQRESCRLSLLKAAEKAVLRINRMVEKDENLAFKVAKEMGLFKSPQGTAADARRARHEIILEHWEEESKLDRRIAEQVASRKERRKLETDLEDELTFAIEYNEAPQVAQKAINS